jgi:hypothetical protein
MGNGVFISLQGSAFGLLATPAEFSQEFPDMPRMIGNAKALLDQTRNPR